MKVRLHGLLLLLGSPVLLPLACIWQARDQITLYYFDCYAAIMFGRDLRKEQEDV